MRWCFPTARSISSARRHSSRCPTKKATATDEWRAQNAALDHALAAFRQGKYDLVVVHVTYTDHTAHELGIAAAEYRRRFAQVDAMVARVEAAIPAQDTFVLLGDHGHDAAGRHALGLDVPTFTLYRGPRTRAGVDLGTISIRDHRYLMGYALGLSLPADYSAGRYPRALVASAPLPAAYALSAAPASGGDAGVAAPERTAPPRDDRVLERAVRGVVDRHRVGRRRGAARHGGRERFAVLVPGAFNSLLRTTRWPAASSAWLGWSGSSRATARRRRACLRWGACSALALAGGAGFYVLGRILVWLRPMVHEPRYETLTRSGLAVWAGRDRARTLARDARIGWALCALPMLLFFPTVYRYGAPAAMGPAWMGWALCAVASGTRPASGEQRDARALVGVTLALCLALLFPFKGTDALEFQFDRFTTWPLPDVPAMWLALATLAKLVLFVRPKATARVHVAAVGLVALLTAAQLGLLVPNVQLVLAAAATSVVVALRRRATGGATSRSLAHMQRIALLAALLLLHHALVRTLQAAFYWQDCLLAALVLSARLARRLPETRIREAAHALLLVFALFATIWIAFGWTVHRLEWGFLYDWFSPPFVEHHVVFFLPAIIARYLIPLFVARICCARSSARNRRARCGWRGSGQGQRS